jgi:integrase
MAVQDGMMAHNPVLDVRPLAIEFTERPYLPLAQISDYLDACGPQYRPLAQLLIGTGARVSEAIALHVQDVDFTAGTVRIHKQRVRGDSLAVRTTKGRNLRTAAVGPGLLTALSDMLAVRVAHGGDGGGWLVPVPSTSPPRSAAAPPTAPSTTSSSTKPTATTTSMSTAPGPAWT